MSASIIAPLVISGSRKADGTANDSGKVWAYLPNTSTAATLYSTPDATAIATQPIVLDEGGRVSAADCPDGLFTAIPIRLYVEDSAGGVVSDSLFTPATAATVSVDNDGFPAASTMDDVLTQLYTSFGGTNGNFIVSGGGVERTIRSKFTEIWVSVKDFGAKGDGIAIDTTAIQSAINYVKALGGGVVYFPPGTYKIDQALTLSTATGVSVRGAGQGVSILDQTAAATNAFTLATCTDFSMQSIAMDAPIVMTDAVRPKFDRVTVSDGAYGLNIGGTLSTDGIITNCEFTGTTRSMLLANAVRFYLAGDKFNNISGTAVEFSGSTGALGMFGCIFAATTGVVFNSALTGLHFVIAGCPSLGFNTTTAIDMTGLATLPDLRQWGNNVDASATSSAGGATQTPVLYRGSEVILTAASGAGAVTVAPPAILPGTASTDVGLYWDFVFKNVIATTWTTDAIYVLDGAVAIPGTIAHTIQVRFRWDRTTSKLRECSRSDTLT